MKISLYRRQKPVRSRARERKRFFCGTFRSPTAAAGLLFSPPICCFQLRTFEVHRWELERRVFQLELRKLPGGNFGMKTRTKAPRLLPTGFVKVWLSTSPRKLRTGLQEKFPPEKLWGDQLRTPPQSCGKGRLRISNGREWLQTSERKLFEIWGTPVLQLWLRETPRCYS